MTGAVPDPTLEGKIAAGAVPVLAAWGVRSRHGEWTDRETQENAARDLAAVLAPLVVEVRERAVEEALRDAAVYFRNHSTGDGSRVVVDAEPGEPWSGRVLYAADWLETLADIRIVRAGGRP